MSRNARFALAGLQTGISGALAMLMWLGVASAWSRRSVWWVPNLVASSFYGEAALRNSFGKYTLTGVALSVVIYGLIGLLFGLAVRERPPGARTIGISLAVAMVAYAVIARLIWKSAVPLANLYSPDRQILLGHAIYGFVLARFPRNQAAL